jgi:hypothetical protein
MTDCFTSEDLTVSVEQPVRVKTVESELARRTDAALFIEIFKINSSSSLGVQLKSQNPTLRPELIYIHF